ncbi:alpha/beta hydrolase [Pedobacter jamesrossensis]|uniref:Alpha/beta hydrolase n=1 Tax=Pedobacter jamesrossensis TaxID=1908238 RepID=A0ABV8NSU0_9SPHI
MQKVSFKNRTWDLAGNIFLPENFDDTKKYPAIVCVHPGSSVKEQTAGLYATELALNGFIALAFDASFQGESGGEPRFLEDPATRVEDIRCAIDYLTTLVFVDNDRIGAMGVCAGGGYAANASLSEKRIKAIATVIGTNASRAFREANPIETLTAVSQQRTAEANGAEKIINNWIPDSAEEAEKLGLEEMDLLEAIDYYRTPRGQHPNSCNKLLFTSMSNLIMFDAFHLAEYFLTQPLLVIVGDKVGGFGSYRDGFDLYNKAASANKKIHIVKGASHYDLYDQPEATKEALKQLIPFFQANI